MPPAEPGAPSRWSAECRDDDAGRQSWPSLSPRPGAMVARPMRPSRPTRGNFGRWHSTALGVLVPALVLAMTFPVWLRWDPEGAGKKRLLAAAPSESWLVL